MVKHVMHPSIAKSRGEYHRRVQHLLDVGSPWHRTHNNNVVLNIDVSNRLCFHV